MDGDMDDEAERDAIIEREIAVQWERLMLADIVKQAVRKKEEAEAKFRVERVLCKMMIEEFERAHGAERKLLESELADMSHREKLLLEKLSTMEASKNCVENLTTKLETIDLQDSVVDTPKPLELSSFRTSNVINRRICKRFPNGIFFGTVKSYDRKNKWWRILFDDGEHVEEFDRGELEHHLRVYESIERVVC